MDNQANPYPQHPRTGHLECTVTGTPYPFPDLYCTRVILAAHPDNSEEVWVGLVTGTPAIGNRNGMPLVACGPWLPFEGLINISRLSANADSAGDRVCWVILDDTTEQPV